MRFEFLEHTDRGLVREVNEDNLGHSLQTKSGDIFVVCDGMGGHVGGKTASTIGVSSIISNLSQQAQGNMHVAISDSLIFANEQVLGHGEADPSLRGMGSTAIVALFKDDLLYLGHVGDSRAYLYSDGKLYRLTKDDSYVQGLIDNGTITEDEAEVHPNRNRILQALGSKTTVKPRIPNRPFKLKTGDLLMLCSDGLTSMVVDEFIEQLIDPNNLSGTIGKLHDIAMTNGGKDNITITLVKITESPFFSSEFDHFTQKYKETTNSLSQAQFESTMVPPTPIKKNNTVKYITAAAAFLVLAFGSYQIFGPEAKSEQPLTNNQNTSSVDDKNQTKQKEDEAYLVSKGQDNTPTKEKTKDQSNELNNQPDSNGKEGSSNASVIQELIKDTVAKYDAIKALDNKYKGDYFAGDYCLSCDDVSKCKKDYQKASNEFSDSKKKLKIARAKN
jgi:serine/threonine protein phosphatase PrpC